MRQLSRAGWVGLLLLVAAPAHAQSLTPPDRAIVQYFEATWPTIRYRMPDVFMAGYGGVWLPPVWKGASGSPSIGYDLFDRFDLGSPSAPTHYGTESEFRQLMREFHKANIEVYPDLIMNHNASKDKNTPNFLSQGGYPGFLLQESGGDPDGDFHAYAAGCPQSTNPADPCYNLYDGRLVGLIDIDQAKNLNYIRHPVASGNPQNIPQGTIYNRPAATNARFYSDQGLASVNVANPGTTRNPGASNYTIFPFNLVDPMQGDPTVENATGLLLRSTRWMLEEFGVDGFRLDAAKHIPTWFWDNLWDAHVYQRRKAFDGSMVTPFSFSEVVEGGGALMQDYVRRQREPGSGSGWPAQGWEFGNRDALDLNEAGALRDLCTANGFGNWSNVLNATIDLRDDGFHNGSMGVHHVVSHDNDVAEGTNTTYAEAYVLTRPGRPNVYYNAFQFGAEPNDFPRDNGRDDAIGNGGNLITTLVQIRNGYCRGWYWGLNSTDTNNPSLNDVLVFSRRTPSSVDNVLIALNDRQDNGFDIRNIQTNWPNGTRLRELTGSAADPVVDPTNEIPDILVVDTVDGVAGRVRDASDVNRKYLRIPRARNGSGAFHGRGYVIYGPTPPSGTLSVTNVAETLPPDDSAVEDWKQRLTPIDVIRSNTFDIVLQTTQTDPLDPDTDNKAVFRIDAGFRDYNGNSVVDYNASTFESGAEDFLTQNSPLYGGGTGTYRQTIDATLLSEGYHYISVWAYKRRATGWPIFKDFRKVIYVDRVPPQVTLISPTQTGNDDVTTTGFTAVVQSTDPTVTRVHIFLNQPASTDFVALANSVGNPGLAGQSGDLWSRQFFSTPAGNIRIDVVAFDDIGNSIVMNYPCIEANNGFGLGLGDMNNSGKINGADIPQFVNIVAGGLNQFIPAGDFTCDGLIDANDVPGFVEKLLTAQ